MTGELIQGPLASPYEQPGLNDKNSPRIMPLIPEISNEENRSNVSPSLAPKETIKMLVSQLNTDVLLSSNA